MKRLSFYNCIKDGRRHDGLKNKAIGSWCYWQIKKDVPQGAKWLLHFPWVKKEGPMFSYRVLAQGHAFLLIG